MDDQKEIHTGTDLTIASEDHAPAVVQNTDPMLSMMERVALNPDADVAKMQALLDMRRSEEDRVAERAFDAAMASAQNEMLPVVRDKNNDQTRSKYATLEAISRAIKPLWTKHGFSLSFGTGDNAPEGHHRVICRVSHAAGHHRDVKADIPVDDKGMQGKVNKTGTHAFGSTVSYGRRYLTMMIFDIATGDDDDGNMAGRAPDPRIGAEAYQYLIDEIERTGSDPDRVAAFLKVDDLHTITEAQLGRVTAMLAKKRAQAEAEAA